MFKNMRTGLVLIVFFVGLSGCGLSDLPVPESTAEKIAYAEATLTGITITVTELNDSRIISLEDAVFMDEKITNAEDLLKLAKAALLTVDEAKARSELSAALSLLKELNKIIIERGQ